MRLRLRLVILTVWLGLGLVVALPVEAHEMAPASQKAAMIYDSSGRFYGGLTVAEPRSAPLKCFVADISTVAGGGQWGAWTFSLYADQPAHTACRTANGITLEHRIDGRWYVLWEGSSGMPPTRTTRDGMFLLRGVPRKIARDLVSGLDS